VKTVRLERNMAKTLDHFWAGYGDGTRVGVRLLLPISITADELISSLHSDLQDASILSIV
jgi:hypothetical protein